MSTILMILAALVTALIVLAVIARILIRWSDARALARSDDWSESAGGGHGIAEAPAYQSGGGS